jgi:hypothetical protein
MCVSPRTSTPLGGLAAMHTAATFMLSKRFHVLPCAQGRSPMAMATFAWPTAPLELLLPTRFGASALRLKVRCAPLHGMPVHCFDGRVACAGCRVSGLRINSAIIRLRRRAHTQSATWCSAAHPGRRWLLALYHTRRRLLVRPHAQLACMLEGRVRMLGTRFVNEVEWACAPLGRQRHAARICRRC